jgi:hypothetical protein
MALGNAPARRAGASGLRRSVNGGDLSLGKVGIWRMPAMTVHK